MKTKRVTKVPRLTKSTTAYGLLDMVRDVILEEPRRYNQSWWISRPNYFPKKVREFPSCGTVCCVAGWVETLRGTPTKAVALTKVFTDNNGYRIATTAQRALGLSAEQASTLFGAGALLSHRGGRAMPAQGSLAYARLGAKHIAEFQKQHEPQLRAKVVRPVRSKGTGK